MDEGFALDLEEVLKNIDNAEVMSLFFPTLRKAVVIDTRHSATEDPLVRIMPMVASPQERLKTIRRLRPKFPRLQNLTLIPWAGNIESLVRLGVWERIVNRFVKSGHFEVVNTCQEVLQELRRLEKAELAAAVLGENYYTIWSARK